MNDINDIKEELTNLVFSDRKEEAIELLQNKYGANRKEAERLLGLALRETVTPARLFSRAIKAVPEILPGKGKGCRKTAFKFIAIFFGFIGLPFLFISIVLYFYNDHLIKQSDLVEGIVVELRPYPQYGEPMDYTPIINYQFNGETYSIEAPVYSDTPEFSIDEQVELYVLRDEPTSVIINTYTQKWFTIVLIGSIGGFFTLGMIVFIFLGRTKGP